MQRRNSSNEAGARADGMLMVSIIFVTAFTYIALTTSPVYTGIGVGDRAPELEGQVWDGTNWVSFDLHENFDPMWDEEGTTGGTWYMVEFMDTNCPHCQTAGKEMQDNKYEDYWINGGANLNENTNVKFLAVAIALHPDDWDYGQQEIIDFRADYNHKFDYMDDHDNTNRDVWGIPGTPTYFLVAPNGVIKYSSPEESQQDPMTVWEAMENIIPRGGA